MIKIALATFAFTVASLNVVHANNLIFSAPHKITRTERKEAIERYCGVRLSGPDYEYCLKVHAKQQRLAAFRAIKFICEVANASRTVEMNDDSSFNSIAAHYDMQHRCLNAFAKFQTTYVRQWTREEAGLARWRMELAQKAGSLHMGALKTN
jgi:hypothetical protein